MTVHTRNPFSNTGPIEDASQFFNRKEIVGQILARLFAEESQRHISIIGLRKWGKSSLVKHLMRPETISAYGYDGDTHLFVYVDCGTLSANTVHTMDFYKLLYQLLRERLSERLPTAEHTQVRPQDASWQEHWEGLLRLTRQHGLTVVVILDQFDIMVMQENLLREGLFGSLRVYGGNRNFSWITCTYQTLPVLFDSAFKTYRIPETKRTSESDFFNQFTTSSFYFMGLFEPEEITQLVTLPLAEQQAFTREQIESIVRAGGRCAYFVQRICYYLYEAQIHGNSSPARAVGDYLQEVETLWESYWEKLTFPQQVVLYSVASQHPINPAPATTVSALKSLQNMGLIYEEYEHYFPFAEEFSNYIVKQKTDFAPGQPVNQGQELWGLYRVERILGRTYHSQVVKAQDMHLPGRLWAIKLLWVNLTVQPADVQQLHEQLMREARILDTLDHPNIGRIHSVKPEAPALIMPWIEGESLDQLLWHKEEHDEPPLTTLEIVEIGQQLADALAHAHQRDVVHRDIKPNNVIMQPVDGRWVPILIDFDVAHAKDQHTITRAADGSLIWVGNESYAAPEQFSNPRCAEASMDIFALGVVLYELLTNQQPYLLAAKKSALRTGYMLPPPAQEEIPDGLYQVLCAMLRPEPHSRPDARAVAASLQTYAQHLSGAQATAAVQPDTTERPGVSRLKRLFASIWSTLERIMPYEKPE